MFVGDEVVLDVGFAAARAMLADLVQNDLLRTASQDAYGAGIAVLARSGALGLPRVVRVRVRELADTGGQAGLAVRWETSAPDGELFPALDADITLAPAAGQTTLLALAGVYRPPPGSLWTEHSAGAMHRVAAATIRDFLGRLAAGLSRSAGAPDTLSVAPEMP